MVTIKGTKFWGKLWIKQSIRRDSNSVSIDATSIDTFLCLNVFPHVCNNHLRCLALVLHFPILTWWIFQQTPFAWCRNRKSTNICCQILTDKTPWTKTFYRFKTNKKKTHKTFFIMKYLPRVVPWRKTMLTKKRMKHDLIIQVISILFPFL